MNNTTRSVPTRWLASLSSIALLLAFGLPAHATSDSWNVDAAGTWVTSGNWLGGNIPGANPGTASTDVATFSKALTAARTVTVDAGRNIGTITFAHSTTTTANGYTLATGALNLSSGGVIEQTAGTHIDTISSTIVVQGDPGTLTIRNTVSGTVAGLVINTGGITGAATAGNTTTITLDGVSTSNSSGGGANNATPIIGDGSGGGKVAVVKNGTGLWTMALANTFSGGMAFNAGTIRFFGNTSGYLLGSGTATIANGVTFNHGNGTATSTIQSPLQVNGDFTLSGGNNARFGGTVDLNGGTRTITANAGDWGFTNIISNGGLIKAGTASLFLSGPNTYTGGTTINGGTLFVISPGSLASGAVTVNANSTLAGSGTIGGAVTAVGNSIIAPGSNAVGTLTLSSDLTLAGSGTLIFEITNTASADKIVVGGNLYSTAPTTVSLPNTATLTNADYTLMEVTGSLGGSASDFNVTTPDPKKIYAIVYVAGSPNKVVLRVSDNTFARTWYGGGGNTWDLNTANKVWTNVIFGGPLTNYLDGNVVTFDSVGSANPSVNITTTVTPGGIIVTSATDYAFSGVGKISGTGLFSKSGTGALSVSTGNDYSGNTTLSGGLVKVAVDNALGTGGLILNGSKLGTLATVTLANTPVTVSAATEITNAQDLTLSGAVGGAGAVTKSGAGTLKLTATGQNSFSGPWTVSAGTLWLDALPTASSVTLGGSGTTGTLDYAGTSGTSGKSYTMATGGTGVIQVDYSYVTLTLSKEINGGGSLIKNGDGALTLSVSNSFSGGLTVNAGKLSINSDYALGTGTLTFNNTSTFGAGGQTTTNNMVVNGNVTIGANCNVEGQISGNGSITYDSPGFTLALRANNSAFSGPVTNASANSTIQVKLPNSLGTGKLYLNGGTLGGHSGGSANGSTPLTNAIVLLADSAIGNNQALDLAGPISGGFAVTRNGTGKMVWSGANTYSGDTTLAGTGGTYVNGSLASPNVIVNAGTLGGAGTISGAVAVNSTATLAPGTNANAVGALTINNTLTFAGGSTNLMDLDGLNNTNDTVKGLSAVTFNGTLTVTSLGGTFAAGDSYKLFYASSYSGNFTATNLPALVGGLEWAWNPANGVLSIVSGPRAISWTGNSGASGTRWDINTSTNWINTSAGNARSVYLEGDPVTFSDIGATNPTVSLMTTLSPVSVTVNSSSNYTFTGSGYISGASGLIKDGSGTLTLGTANDYSGVTTISGGTLAISGSLSNAAGEIDVNGGKLAVSGAVNIGAGALVAGGIATNGVISINTGGNVTVNDISIGNTMANGNGALTVAGGNLTMTNTSGIGGSGGYGALTLSSGSITGTFIQLGNGSAAQGVGLISGGTLTASDYIIVGRGSTGVLTVGPGGSVSHVGAGHNLTVAHAAGSRGELNLTGGNVDSTGRSLVFGEGSGTTGTGIVNLNAGKLIVDSITNPDGTNRLNFNGGTLQPAVSTTSFIAAGLPIYLHGAFGSFAGGAVIDTPTSVSVTNAAPLLAPSGSGVSAISVAGTQGSGYIGAPYVQISGDGSGATAFANMVDDGTGGGTLKVGGVTVSNPGEGYTTATATFVGGGTATAASGTVSLAPNTSGGLVKLGAGMLAISGASTYTGGTIVSNGTLSVQNTTGSGTGTGTVTVKSGAILAANGVISGATTVESLGGVGGKGFINTLAVNSFGGLSPGNYDTGTLTVNTLTLAGSSYTFMDIDKTSNTKDMVTGLSSIAYGGTLVVTNLSGTFTGGESYQLFSAPSLTGNFSAFTLPTLNAGLTWVWNPTGGTLSVAASTGPQISYGVSGGVLTLSWPSTGWYAQSNAVSVADSNSWFNIPGSETVTSLNITLNPGQPKVFYRLLKP
jgi:fibronectin-binding autotransporter adhesin